MSAAGGDSWSAQKAYDQMMTQSRNTILNCSLKTLAVGRADKDWCDGLDVLGCIGTTRNRVSWVADFS
jgi:hypothetical protein